MAFSSRRKIAPTWPSLKNYEQLHSGDSLLLTPLPPTPHSGWSEPTIYSPTPLLHDPLSPRTKHRLQWWTHGWKGGVRISLLGAVAVLVINIAILVGILVRGQSMVSGIYMVYRGSCEKTELRNTWVHLGLNLVATMLLASSNYCMQLLSAPTRGEIDRAHARGRWLDIGIPSLRNLGSLSRKRVSLWWILGVSSIPMHLVYNSVFYSAIATNNYNILYATPDFIQGAAYNTELFPDTFYCNVSHFQQTASQWQRLDNQDCIASYSKDFVADRSNVIAIIRNAPSNSSSLRKIAINEFPTHITSEYNPFQWICDSPNIANETHSCCENEYGFVPCPNIAPKLQLNADSWSSGGFEIDYCLSEIVPAACHLHFSLVLMGLTLFFNLIKVAGIFYVAFRMREQPFVTVGDAIQSFLQQPDQNSLGMCLATHRSVQSQHAYGYRPVPLRYEVRTVRWYHAATWKQWVLLFSLFFLAGVGTLTLLLLGVAKFNGDASIRSPWSLGLGTVRPQNLLSDLNLPSLGNWAIVVSTLVANSPQVLFSFIYLVYNSVFTTMLLSFEWAKFGVQHRFLRVSYERGNQKSTYFLHLPYRYGIPLLAASALLHWLISQSIVLANIAIIPRDGTMPMKDEINTCAYSPLGILLLLMLMVAMLAYLFMMSRRRLPGGMPLVASNSLAIAAACHVPGAQQTQREDMVLRSLMWGDLSGKFEDDGSSAVGHCAFSDGVVAPPHHGRLYA